jgi:hypothetical protein
VASAFVTLKTTATRNTSDVLSPAVAKAFTVCGERATSADSRIKSMVNQINGLLNTNYVVYQTVAPEQPHASPGGCVF